MDFKRIIEILTKRNQTIATMESCTGGGVANAITNCEGASEILKFSAVTYSNEYKMKMGVPQETIDKYTVYSQQTADEMSKNITKYANSDYGIGITGLLNRPDPNNPKTKENMVYISIYEQKNKTCYQKAIEVPKTNRKENKELVIEEIIKMLLKILN